MNFTCTLCLAIARPYFRSCFITATAATALQSITYRAAPRLRRRRAAVQASRTSERLHQSKLSMPFADFDDTSTDHEFEKIKALFVPKRSTSRTTPDPSRSRVQKILSGRAIRVQAAGTSRELIRLSSEENRGEVHFPWQPS